jgi:hypothetical protein
MLLATSFEEIYSHKKELPLKKYEHNIDEYNLKPKFEDTQFNIRNT